MKTIRMSSDEARTKWREVLDTAVAGNQIIIERYGKPIAMIVPYSGVAQAAEEVKMVREETAVYQTDTWETQKAELVAEIKAALLQEPKLREAILQYELANFRQQSLAHLEEEISEIDVPKVVNIYSPRLARPEQASDFKKEIIAELPNAQL